MRLYNYEVLVSLQPTRVVYVPEENRAIGVGRRWLGQRLQTTSAGTDSPTRRSRLPSVSGRGENDIDLGKNIGICGLRRDVWERRRRITSTESSIEIGIDRASWVQSCTRSGRALVDMTAIVLVGAN